MRCPDVDDGAVHALWYPSLEPRRFLSQTPSQTMSDGAHEDTAKHANNDELSMRGEPTGSPVSDDVEGAGEKLADCRRGHGRHGLLTRSLRCQGFAQERARGFYRACNTKSTLQSPCLGGHSLLIVVIITKAG